MMKSDMRIVDLFSGCGGMSLGFQQAGFDVVAAFDNWSPAVATYRKNFEHPIFQQDLSDVDIKAIQNFTPELIMGGPPCQDFSSAGKRNENLGRADLTLVFAHIVSQVLPEYFIMENVDLAYKSIAYASARAVLRRAGYRIQEATLNASYCGVPQSRKRFFVIGELHRRGGDVLDFINANLSHKSMTVREYYIEKFNQEPNFTFYYRHPRSYERRAIFGVDEPSPTVRGVNRPIPPTYKLHPGDPVQSLDGIRPLTSAERAIIQTFPPDFELLGTKSEIEQLLGNAVPVAMAKLLAQSFQQYLNQTQVVGLEHELCQIENQNKVLQGALF